MKIRNVQLPAADIVAGKMACELLKSKTIPGHVSSVAVNLHVFRKKAQDLKERRAALEECHVRRDIFGEFVIPGFDPVDDDMELDFDSYAGPWTADRDHEPGWIVLHKKKFFRARQPVKGKEPDEDGWDYIGDQAGGIYMKNLAAYQKDIQAMENEVYDVPVRMIPLEALEKVDGLTAEMYFWPMIEGADLPDLEGDKPWEEGDPVPEPHYCDDEMPATNGQVSTVGTE